MFGSAWQGEASIAVVPGGWSVSCEVAFYAALPLLLWIIQGRLWRAAGLTVASCIAVQLIARFAMTQGEWHYVPQYINPLAQAPVFLFGITAAIVFQRVSLPWLPGAVPALLALAICVVPYSPVPERSILHYFLFSALVAAAVALSAAHPPRLLANVFMRRVGEVSYSMYLVHFAMLKTVAFTGRMACSRRRLAHPGASCWAYRDQQLWFWLGCCIGGWNYRGSRWELR